MKKYSVHWVEEIKDRETGEAIGGDDGTIWETDNQKTAFNKAIAWSKKKSVKGVKLHETFVYHYDDNGDIKGHWYFKDGKQTHNMFNS